MTAVVSQSSATSLLVRPAASSASTSTSRPVSRSAREARCWRPPRRSPRLASSVCTSWRRLGIPSLPYRAGRLAEQPAGEHAVAGTVPLCQHERVQAPHIGLVQSMREGFGEMQGRSKVVFRSLPSGPGGGRTVLT